MKKKFLYCFLPSFFSLFLFAFCSCKKENIANYQAQYYSLDMLVNCLNENAKNIQQLIDCYEKDIKVVSCDSSGVKNDSYCFYFEDGREVSLVKFTDNVVQYPIVSIAWLDSIFVWTLNDEVLKNDDGNYWIISDTTNYPMLKCEDDCWYCYNDMEGDWHETKVSSLEKIHIDDSSVKGFVIIDLPPCGQLVFTKADVFDYVRLGVPNKAFYKNVFLDAGVGLTSRKRLAAVTHLGLSLECMSFSSEEDEELQNQLMEGTGEDLNGRLLYPDGQPRYQLLFVNGGNSRTHGKSLSDNSRENMKRFCWNGGSYVGTCAGALFAASGYDDHEDYPYYLHVYPRKVLHTHLSQSYTGMFIEPESPLLQYGDFGGDMYIDSIRHNGGCYPDELPASAEVLARYDYPALDYLHRQPSAWAYKSSASAGRIIQEGSHPEEVSSGERMEFTAAMIQYAIDGCGASQIKGLLRNGERREMVKSTADMAPDYTMIGDLQCHHFVTCLPTGVRNVCFSLQGPDNVDMTLAIRKDTFAYPEEAQFVSSDEGGKHDLMFSSLSGGMWYIMVRCNTTVTTTETSWGQEYSGRTDVLNGVPYSIKVSWVTPEMELLSR